MTNQDERLRALPRFDRNFFGSGRTFSRIGDGEIGGKARGLVDIADILAADLDGVQDGEIDVFIPVTTILTTDVFDAFVGQNGLEELGVSDLPDDRIAHAFQQADLPAAVVGDLRAIVDEVQQPLAVRSSSLLEDALHRPFAGVYGTKMTPNNQSDSDTRFRRLVEAIKFVYASTYFSASRRYMDAAGVSARQEKMAVIIEEIVGARHGDRFYPHLSGVGRSFNYYPTGSSRREDGVVNLALGLGRWIVEGGTSWTYSPASPKAPPPFGSTAQRVTGTQTRFWAVNMGKPPAYHPMVEAEYLIELGLSDADYDGTLEHVASTYDPGSDRLSPGTGRSGPRVIDFAPLLVLERYGFNQVVARLLAVCERALGGAVEIEFAVTWPRQGDPQRARLGFLQVRPMPVSDQGQDISDDALRTPDALISSRHAMGNGTLTGVRDIVYVRPDVFESGSTPEIAMQVAQLNGALLDAGRPYLLIGLGRWGSADPWLGIPVEWSQISGAKVIVEATLPERQIEPSQGSHFFHNLISFDVSYLCVGQSDRPGIDWTWLDQQSPCRETKFLRHLHLEHPLLIKVDGRTGLGGVWHPERG